MDPDEESIADAISRLSPQADDMSVTSLASTRDVGRSKVEHTRALVNLRGSSVTYIVVLLVCLTLVSLPGVMEMIPARYPSGPISIPPWVTGVGFLTVAGLVIYALNVRFFCASDGCHYRKWTPRDRVIAWSEIASVTVRTSEWMQVKGWATRYGVELHLQSGSVLTPFRGDADRERVEAAAHTIEMWADRYTRDPRAMD